MTTPEYYIIGGQKDNRQPYTKLYESDLQIIQTSCDALYKFEYYNKRDIEIQENLKEFLRVYQLAEIDITTKNDDELSKELFNLHFININRTFTNYLSSYKIQVDHFDTYLKSKHGETSDEYIKFQKHKTATYDANFSYRILYNLRNYSQHHYFPLNNITKDSVKDGNGFKVSMLVSFDKNQLLKDKKVVSKIGPDLNHCGDYIPVMPHIRNSETILQDIYKMYLIIEKPSLLEQMDILKKYISVVPTNMEPLYGFWEHLTPTTAACRTTIFPVTVMNKLATKLTEMGL